MNQATQKSHRHQGQRRESLTTDSSQQTVLKNMSFRNTSNLIFKKQHTLLSLLPLSVSQFKV